MRHALLRVFQPPMLGLVCGFGVLVSDYGAVQFFRATAQSGCGAACALSCLRLQSYAELPCFVSASAVLECRLVF